ncbi:TetR/AcrR family transcriptional regulator [Mucilaginibacter sp. cycad4]|uniref:TetR/AcrR family transcriptional regulator n=1 Tax=Mucilaginibacter sp. cycad4 TaxID=3342096 RepID=UPI002AAB8AAC|nr:TetR/AcrR family transcriptional regulator [Mucilaginibacter gossypii]WPU99142.1 TetR/AcrR family transcriptional regulator [Mucilaginibacter gossypii]
MGTLERKNRQKAATRLSILDAAMEIVCQEGWQALSMRKIADLIEYTPPVIYEYFDNKDSLLAELSRIGFSKLNRVMKIAAKGISDPVQKLERMWLAYWDFAFSQKERYQLMFGVGTFCCDKLIQSEVTAPISELVMPVIAKMLGQSNQDASQTERRYFACWSLVHGLISLNLIKRGSSEQFNKRVLVDGIHGLAIMAS